MVVEFLTFSRDARENSLAEMERMRVYAGEGRYGCLFESNKGGDWRNK
jgi:hypothetical protein